MNSGRSMRALEDQSDYSVREELGELGRAIWFPFPTQILIATIKD